MGATLTTETGRQYQHQHDWHEPPSRPVRRVGLVDRVALHVGVALVAWGRRPLEVESRERRANRWKQHRARLEREFAAERMLRLGTPHP